MNRFAIFYLFSLAFKRIKIFLKDWYVNSFVGFWDFLLKNLEKLDKIFAVKITIRHWFEPLYQDRTIVGYILGFIFRTLRILLGSLIYLIVVVFVMFCYLLWAFVPFFLLVKAIA
ncbi:MAG: hypothetical protein ACPLKV_01940 [Minisyncoccia bacterium]